MPIVMGPEPPDIGGFPERPRVRPRDLPEMRGEQKLYGKNFVNAVVEYDLYENSVSDGADEVWRKTALSAEAGRMFFVQKEMIPAVTARAGKVPRDAPIMAIRRPADSGMVVFEKPPALWQHDKKGEIVSPIDAISWVGDPVWGLLAAGWLRRVGSIMDSQTMRRIVGAPMPPWIMTCIMEIPSRSPGAGDEMLQLLVSVWTLMCEPRAVETRTVQRHGKKARTAERYCGGNPPVTVVNVRPGVYGRPADPGSRDGKPLQYLVDVAGHLKTYHVGPGRREKVALWVSPHTRGPQEAPRSPKETIRVLRPEKKENGK